MNRVVHFEIQADDPPAVASFYQNVFGWTINTWEGGSESYWLVSTGDNSTPGINGGIMKRTSPQAVINTIDVASLDDALARIEAAGGKKVHGPYDIPGVGRHAYCADPEGNVFGVMQMVENPQMP